MEKNELQELLEGDPAPLATTRAFSMADFKRKVDEYCERKGLLTNNWNDTFNTPKNDKK